MMNHFLISGIVVSITTLLLGLFTFARKRSLEGRIFFFYCLAIAFWSFCVALHGPSLGREYAPTLGKMLHVGAVFIPVLFLHFTLVLSSDLFHWKRTLWFCYAVSGLFLVLNFFTKLLIDGTTYTADYSFPTPGPLYPLFFIFFVALIIFSLSLLFWRWRNASAYYQKAQMAILFFSSLLGYTGGLDNFLITFNVRIPFLYPFGAYAISLYVLAMTYAILRYRFLDIEVIIKKTLVFAGLSAFVFGVFTAATFVVREVLGAFLGAGNVWASVASIFIIVIGYDPIRNLLVHLTDRIFFQKKYNYQKLLKDASRGMSRIESLSHLLGLVVHFITMRMRVKNTAVLVRKRKSSSFAMSFHRGYQKIPLDYEVKATSPLIQYLTQEKEAIDLEHLQIYMASGNQKKVKGQTPHKYDFEAIRLEMAELEAHCCVPSFLGRELENVLVLGPKKSGDYFTDEDLNVLFTLAQESAIAIENARLYDEAVEKTHELEKINHQLEYSKELLIKALQETEVANKQLQDTQAQLIHEQKMATLGRLAASVGHEVNNPLTILSMNVSRAILKYRKDVNLKVGDILDIFQKMEQNIGRIKAVVNTLTGLLKKSEKGTFEPLSLKLILEETLPLVQFQTYLDNLTGTEVEFDISGNVPLIRGDLERLQEVFLNLFINAYHAMSGRRNRRIKVTAEVDPTNRHFVAVHFEDNGAGMSDEIMKKIFSYGFTTKPPGKGSGMGLYMCKYIIELHGGDIKVASTVGQGTTFTLTIPVYEEALTESGSKK